MGLSPFLRVPVVLSSFSSSLSGVLKGDTVVFGASDSNRGQLLAASSGCALVLAPQAPASEPGSPRFIRHECGPRRDGCGSKFNQDMDRF